MGTFCKHLRWSIPIFCIQLLSTVLIVHGSERQGEFLVDTNIVYVSLPVHYRHPRTSFDGTNYFVIWEDDRSGSMGIYGARVNQSGIVLDSASIAVSLIGLDPAVAFDGTNYLVAWAYNDIYCARITQAGTVIDTIAIIVSTDTIGERHPFVAFDGTNYLVVWGKYAGEWPMHGMSVHGARITPSGTVLDPDGFPIAGAGGWFTHMPVAFGDSSYLVVWQDEFERFYYDVYGTRVSTSGQVLDTVPILISPPHWMEQLSPDVAFDGTNFLVTWILSRALLGKRVSESGQVLDSLPVNIPSTARYPNPAAAFDDYNYLVISGGIVGARVDTLGFLIDSTEIPIIIGDGYPEIVFGDTNYLVVWDNASRDIYGARVNRSVNALDTIGIDISNTVNSQSEPAIAFDGTNYLIAWRDYCNDSWEIRGLRVDAAGSILDTSTVISSSDSTQWKPSAAFGQPYYFVVWEALGADSRYDICAARIDTLGVVLDTQSILLSPSPTHHKCPAVAFDGTNFLVVWEDSSSARNRDIYGALVDTSGTVINQITVSTAPREQVTPSVAFDGTNYFAVWRDAREGNDWNIYGARISPSGTVLDTGIVITTSIGWQYSPSVAFDGTNYLVVWEDDRNGTDVPDIYGARVDTSGVVLDPTGIPIAVALGQQLFPVVTYDGMFYLVLWQDFRSDSTWDIYGAKVSVSGEVLNSYSVCTQSGNQLVPALARGLNNQLLLGYSGWTYFINNHPANIMRIWAKFYPFAGIDEYVEVNKSNTSLSLNVYPNPLKEECIIKYTLTHKKTATISLFDVSGRLIKELKCRYKKVGAHTERFNIVDLSQGVYFVRLSTDNNSAVQKVVLLR